MRLNGEFLRVIHKNVEMAVCKLIYRSKEGLYIFLFRHVEFVTLDATRD